MVDWITIFEMEYISIDYYYMSWLELIELMARCFRLQWEHLEFSFFEHIYILYSYKAKFHWLFLSTRKLSN